VKTSNFFTGILLVLVCFLVSEAATTRRYTGVEVQALIDTINQHQTMINQINGDLGYFAGKLNSDSGVTYTNFAPTTSSTTVADGLRR
jgi:hypothetical protein